MHWLIPLISHTLSSFLAWQRNTLTATAVLISFLLAATHSTHLWPGFYGLFALYIATGTGLSIISGFRNGTSNTTRNDRNPPWIRTSLHLLTNVLVAAAVVPLHHLYLNQRLVLVPWFHITRARAGCLPVPSRTLHVPFQFGFADALGNQLPFGIVVSYATAMARLFSYSVGGKSSAHESRILENVAGVFGALILALIASYGLPMCEPDTGDGQHEVMMHVDRSVEWAERSGMAWSPQARYGTFVVLVTVAGMTGAALADRLTSAFRQHKTAQGKPPAGTDKAVSEKTAIKGNPSNSSQPIIQETQTSGAVDAISYHMASLCAHVLLTTTVGLGMAVWSWTGPRLPRMESQMQGGKMGN